MGYYAPQKAAKGHGAGQFLLMDALCRSLDAASEIAAMAVVVDAKDASAAAFYRYFGFTELQRQPRRLFLPVELIATLFGGPTP